MVEIIDIGLLGTANRAARHETVAAIRRACRDTGFFYAANHNVPERLIDAVYRQAARIHALPMRDKLALHISLSRNHRGYVPPGEEDYGNESGTGAAPDTGQKAAFDLAAERAPDDPDFLAGYRFQGPNVWPALTGFREAVRAYYDAVIALGHRLLGGFAEAMDLPPQYFSRYFAKPTANLRLLHYPAQDLSGGQSLGIGSHTDSEFMTLLHQTRPGLQVMDSHGAWLDVPPEDGTFVVNSGDILETWSNGYFKSGPHRVLNVAEERFSLPLFFAPDFDVEVTPLEKFITPAHPAAYQPLITGSHILSEYAKGFKYLRALHRDGALSLITRPEEASRFAREASST